MCYQQQKLVQPESIHILTVRCVTCRQACWSLDCDPLSADCHDWAGHCVLRHSREEHAVSVPSHMFRMARGYLRFLWAVCLDRCVCRHPDVPLNGEPSHVH